MPVSKAAWAKLPKAQRGNKTYAQYVQWTKKTVAKRAAAKRGAATAAMAGIDPGLMPTPSSVLRHEAHNQIYSQITPILTQIQNDIARQRRAGIADINAATGQSIKAVQPLAGQIGTDYNQAINEQNALNTNLSNFIRGAGQEAQGDLTKQLSASGLPAPGAVTQLGGLGQGSGTMVASSGATGLERLIGDRARELAYARGLPGSYRQIGTQNIGHFSRQMADQLSQQMGAVTQQAPGLVQSTYQNLLQREFEKATARQGFLSDKMTAQAKVAAAGAKTQADRGIVSASASRGANDGHAHNKWGETIYDQNGNPLPWKPPKGGGGGTTDQQKFQKRLDSFNTKAVNLGNTLHKAMMTRLQTPTNKLDPLSKPPQGAQAKAIVQAARKSVAGQMYNYYKTNFPGQNDAWWKQKAAGALRASGWPAAADDLTGATPTTTGAGTRTPASAGGGNQLPAGGWVVGQAKNFVSRKAPIEKTYGMLVNAILKRGYQVGAPIKPEDAWWTAQIALSQVAPNLMSTQKRIGDPKNLDRAYVPYTQRGSASGAAATSSTGIPTTVPKKPKKPTSQAPYKPGRQPKKPPKKKPKPNAPKGSHVEYRGGVYVVVPGPAPKS